MLSSSFRKLRRHSNGGRARKKQPLVLTLGQELRSCGTTQIDYHKDKSAHFLTGALHDLCPMDNGTGTRRTLLRRRGSGRPRKSIHLPSAAAIPPSAALYQLGCSRLLLFLFGFFVRLIVPLYA